MNKHVATILVVAALILFGFVGIPALTLFGLPIVGAGIGIVMLLMSVTFYAGVWMVARTTALAIRLTSFGWRVVTWPIRRAFATASGPYYRAKARRAGRNFRGQGVHPIPS